MFVLRDHSCTVLHLSGVVQIYKSYAQGIRIISHTPTYTHIHMHSPAHQEHAVDQKARLGTFPALRQLSMKKKKNPNQNKPTHTSAYEFCRHSNTALPGNGRVMYVGV